MVEGFGVGKQYSTKLCTVCLRPGACMTLHRNIEALESTYSIAVTNTALHKPYCESGLILQH